MTDSRRALFIRLSAALVASGLLYWLGTAADKDHPVWPGTQPGLFVPLGLVAAGAPLLVIAGAGSFRPRALAAWAAAGTVVLAGLGYAGYARNAPGPDGLPSPLLWPPLVPALLLGFFVAHTLATDAAVTGRPMPPYGRHFDTAWKLAVQTRNPTCSPAGRTGRG